MSRGRAVLARPVDAASVAAFRIGFGVLMAVASARFFWRGWIDADYRAAKVFLPYWGLEFLRPLPGLGMYGVYAVMFVAALLVAAGAFYRVAAIVYTLTFTYAHLCDRTNYLNHYYLVSLLAALFVVMPLDREFSLRVWRRPQERRTHVAAWVLWLLRFQIGCVYFFGGVAKLGVDWLRYGEPLRIWLAADAELPILRWIAAAHQREFAIAFGWCGMLFDLSIVPLLWWPRTRVLAYVAVLAFHFITWVLFPIGMFPWIMCAGATLFFDPAWPRRKPASPTFVDGKLSRAHVVLIAVYVAIQVLMPLRHFAYPGNTLWSEEGFRFAWRVMLIEKSGDLELRVVDRTGHTTNVAPRNYLTPTQRRQVATQPDMILAFAHLVADDFARRGLGPVQVYVDAEVSWNGRAHTALVDPRVDLARVDDTLWPKPWIMPAPTGAPQF